MDENITLDRSFVQSLAKMTNLIYGLADTGEFPGLDLDELQLIDERLQYELSKTL